MTVTPILMAFRRPKSPPMLDTWRITKHSDLLVRRRRMRGAVPHRRWPDIGKVAKRKLDMLDAAERPNDLWSPPGNR